MGCPVCWLSYLIVLFLFYCSEASPSNIHEKPATQMKVPKYRLWDVAQKSLYLRNNQLVAGYLQGSNSALEEKIYCVTNRLLNPEKFPIILSIQEGRRSLACGTGTPPVLQLEDGMWRFESAANPGWLLCTSAQSNEPLGLTLHQDAAHIVDFYFQLF
uniref:Interleukin-1 receptor antagonist protein n=1 Tax=Chrysemys picta bellii TaxID=8478 RepID=A0A8C3II52_CHRPI